MATKGTKGINPKVQGAVSSRLGPLIAQAVGEEDLVENEAESAVPERAEDRKEVEPEEQRAGEGVSESSLLPAEDMAAEEDVEREALLERVQALEAEVHRLEEENKRLGKQTSKAPKGGLREVPNPYPDGVWDALVGARTPTPIKRGPEHEAILNMLNQAVREVTGYNKGAAQLHVYNLALMSLKLLPDLDSRFRAHLAPYKGKLGDNYIQPIYESLWRAIIESVEGLKVGR